MSNKNLTSLEKVLNYSIYYEDSYGFSRYENGLIIDYVDFMRKVKDLKDDSSCTFYRATGSYKGTLLKFEYC